jgi:hypothetical protein
VTTAAASAPAIVVDDRLSGIRMPRGELDCRAAPRPLPTTIVGDRDPQFAGWALDVWA